ncbi:hypothetical protein KEM55_007815 [Ascosphaera atra]|nr:hypothetical protein KEM55_007815 [Ascosphaera atra]
MPTARTRLLHLARPGLKPQLSVLQSLRLSFTSQTPQHQPPHKPGSSGEAIPTPKGIGRIQPFKPDPRELPKTEQSELQRPKYSYFTIFHAGTGRVAFLGMLRAATVLTFGIFVTVVAPAFYFDPDSPTWMAPLLFAAGAIPMAFVAYTSAPFVNQIYLSVPPLARRSEQTLARYFETLPRSTKLNIVTMKFMFWPRSNIVTIGDLAPASARLRPVSFRTKRPVSKPWYEGGSQVYFYAPRKSKGNGGRRFRPEVWERIYSQLQF